MKGVYDIINISRQIADAIGHPGSYIDFITAASNIYLANQLQKEIVIEEVIEKIPASKWDKLDQCSTKLRNILEGKFNYYLDKNYNRIYHGQIQDINSLNMHSFLKIRNAGKKTWEEFVKLRGF